jgi:hypothetical protein
MNNDLFSIKSIKFINFRSSFDEFLGRVWLGCGFSKICRELCKSCCEKTAVGKAEDRLVRAAVSCGKLCVVDEIPVIPPKVCGIIYIPKYS